MLTVAIAAALEYAERVDLGEIAMNVIVEIPDDVAERLSAAGGDLSRRALEALLADEYR